MTIDERYTVQLGDRTYEVVPQPLPLLKHDLAEKFEQLANMDVQGSRGIGDFLTGNLHSVLSAFIPDLMPLHEWEGYPSAAAMEKGVLDREYARKAPTGPQAKLALDVAMKANDLDVWRNLGDLLDPTTRRELVGAAVQTMMKGSPSTTSPNGSSLPALASTTSTTTPNRTARRSRSRA